MTTNSKDAINHVMKAIPFEPHVHHRRRRNEFLSQFASRKCFVTSRTQCYIWEFERGDKGELCLIGQSNLEFHWLIYWKRGKTSAAL